MEKSRCTTRHVCYRWVVLGTLLFLLPIRAGLFYIQSVYAPRVQEVAHFPASSQIYDRNGVLLYEFFGDVRRIPVPKEDIPQDLRFATLMAEDERFFQHAGFDPIGIVRAAYRNWKADQVVEGASTIGQQLVKNTVFGPAEGYKGKLREVLMSIAVDLAMSKEDILHLYLNTIPYGGNVYGVEAASRLYFDKHVRDLTLAESATLAALPTHPTYLSPFGEHTDELKARRDYILGKMYAQKLISEIAYSTALSAPMTFAKPETEIKAPHFVMYVRQQLEQVLGKQRVEEGGLVIKTTLDYSLQQKAYEAMDAQAARLDRYQADSAGIVALNPKTGQILTMVGNRNYFDTDSAGKFNMAVAKRQPGSAFKPIVYSAFFEQQNANPATILLDVPRNFSQTDKPYVPKDYDLKSRGPVTARQALAESLNIPAVEALTRVGIDEALDYAEDMGIGTLDDRSRFGPSLVLGGAEVTLVDLVSAYGVFANNGSSIQPQSILDIQTIDGKQITWKRPLPRQTLKPETAYEITSILSDNTARTPVFGPRSPLAFTERQVAAKTGTTQEYRDAWTIGYTPQIVAGVWVGNHDNTPLRYGAAGAVVAAPLWRSFMDGFLEYAPIESFQRPDDMQLVSIPTVLGVKQEYLAPWQMTPPQGTLVRGGDSSFNAHR